MRRCDACYSISCPALFNPFRLCSTDGLLSGYYGGATASLPRSIQLVRPFLDTGRRVFSRMATTDTSFCCFLIDRGCIPFLSRPPRPLVHCYSSDAYYSECAADPVSDSTFSAFETSNCANYGSTDHRHHGDRLETRDLGGSPAICGCRVLSCGCGRCC